jgi:hypothetical protein
VARRIAGIGLIAALILVLTSAACLACTNMPTNSSARGCCDKNRRCPATPVNPAHAHQECAPPDTDLSKVEHSFKAASFTVVLDAGAPPELVSRVVLPLLGVSNRVVHSHSSPDLCLLNSVLTI